MEIVGQLVHDCLTRAAGLGARTVVMSAFATGYGHLTLRDFAESLRYGRRHKYPPLEQVTLCLFHEDRAEEMMRALQATGC